MNLSTRQAGHWQHELDIEVPVDEVETRLEEVARKFQQRAALPGFRRGRVPLEMVRSHFAEHLEQDFLETFVPQIAGDAVAEARLNPAIPPLVHDLRFTPGQPLRFKVLVDVRPEVEARDYKGLPLRRAARHVEEEAVGRVLEGLREDTAVFEDLARPAERGDVVLLDSTRLDANGRRMPATRQKGLRVQLGAPAMLPDLENGLLGAVEGQERTVEIGYPEDYPNPDLAGRRHRYVVRVRKIQAKKLRELDDNLARDVFKLESLEELRSRVRLNLEGEERLRVQREAEAAIVEELVRRNEFPLPERLEAYMLERVIREAVGERAVDDRLVKELEERYRPGVQRSLRREILLAAIARQENLSVGDEDVAREIDRMAQADPRQAARVRARYQSAERREALRESLLERRALEWLIEKADVTEEAAGASPIVVPAGR
jgi:trigger factor